MLTLPVSVLRVSFYAFLTSISIQKEYHFVFHYQHQYSEGISFYAVLTSISIQNCMLSLPLVCQHIVVMVYQYLFRSATDLFSAYLKSSLEFPVVKLNKG